MKLVYRIKQAVLIFGDFISFALSFCLTLTIRYWHTPDLSTILAHTGLYTGLFFCWIVINYINGLYDLSGRIVRGNLYRRIAETAFIILIFSIIYFYLIPNADITPKRILFLNVIIGYSVMSLWRMLFNKYIGSQKLRTNVIFVGITAESQNLMDFILHHPQSGYHIVSVIDLDKTLKNHENEFAVYHELKSLRPAITAYQAQLVVIAPHLQHDEEALRELYELLFWSVEIVNATSFYENITGRIPPATFSEGWFLEHIHTRVNPLYEKWRTVLDYFAGICMGLVFVTLGSLLALAIRVSSPGPIFIRQKRVGLNGEVFTLYKFRSMYALSADGSAEVAGVEFAKKEDKRITPLGKFLRKTRLDELPQCINLMKRDVTLIGPRPERPEIVEQLTLQMPFYPLRHVVRPGLAGWAVLHQNYTDTIEKSLEKLQYDLYYIKNRSFLLDISILLRTVNVVLRLMGQ